MAPLKMIVQPANQEIIEYKWEIHASAMWVTSTPVQQPAQPVIIHVTPVLGLLVPSARHVSQSPTGNLIP